MRAVEDFVRESAMRGRNDHQIRAVASCTRWERDGEEIEELLEEYGVEWREIGREQRYKARLAKKIRYRKHEEKPAERRVFRVRRKRH
jgi:hypothetical protein